jgi:arsenical pump membrane protein
MVNVSPLLVQILIATIVAFSILLMLIRPGNIPEVWWVGSGAFLLVALRLIPLHLAGKAVMEGADVYLFLIGMMLLSELGSAYGVFDWVAAKSARGAKGECARLFLLTYGVGTLTTIFMSNDATAVVLTPAVLSAVRKAKVKPMPYLFACAMIANAASFVLPISNPANLVVFHQGMPPLKQWLASFSIPSIFSIAATFLVLRLYFRKDLSDSIQEHVEDRELRPAGKLVLWGLGFVVTILMTASALNKDLGLPTLLGALFIAAVISIKEKANPVRLLKALSWPTILLVAGLFVLVDAMEGLGVLRYTRLALEWCQSLAPAIGTAVVGISVGIANNIFNNLPLGLVAGATVQEIHLHGLLAHALLVGVDLGPNLSVTGSLATILWLLALRKEKLDVSAWDFLQAGAIAMPVAMIASVAGLLLTHAISGN